jgi:hypothetical protein
VDLLVGVGTERISYAIHGAEHQEDGFDANGLRSIS